MKHRDNQSQAAKHLLEGPSITVQEMADSMGDKVRKMALKEKEKKQRDKDERSLETERDGIKRKLERQLVEEEEGNLILEIFINIEQLIF